MLPEIQVRKRDSFRYSSVYHPSIHHPKNPFGGCEIQSTVREPVRANMYKGVSAAYTIIVMSYWTLAFTGYWAFGSEVQPYILSSLTAPRWVLVMANLFAVIQITGCFQVNNTRYFFVKFGDMT
jgi:hypothetical protein